MGSLLSAGMTPAAGLNHRVEDRPGRDMPALKPHQLRNRYSETRRCQPGTESLQTTGIPLPRPAIHFAHAERACLSTFASALRQAQVWPLRLPVLFDMVDDIQVPCLLCIVRGGAPLLILQHMVGKELQ